MPIVTRIDWTEYERGWGSRPDGTTLYLSRDAAEAHCAADRAKQGFGHVVPHEYSAPGEMRPMQVSQALYDQVAAKTNGPFWWTVREHLPLSDGLKGAKREIPWGSHQFVYVRPISRDWSELDGTTMKVGREEFRPAMIRGIDDGQRVYVIGSQFGYEVDQFEIGNDITQPFGAL